MIKPLTFAPNNVLSTPTKRVAKIDKKVQKIISDMKETLQNSSNPRGVGLAAPQVGIPLQIFVAKPTDDDLMRVFINPEITWKSKHTSDDRKQSGEKGPKLEGCLSIKNIWGTVARHTQVKLKFMDENGSTKEEKFTDFYARIIQHEVDHLNGTLFTQRVLEQKGRLFKPAIDKDGNEILQEFGL